MDPQALLGFAGISAFFVYAREWLSRLWVHVTSVCISRSLIWVRVTELPQIAHVVDKQHPPLFEPSEVYCLLPSPIAGYHKNWKYNETEVASDDNCANLLRLSCHTLRDASGLDRLAAGGGPLSWFMATRRHGWRPFWLSIEQNGIPVRPAGEVPSATLIPVAITEFRGFGVRQHLQNLMYDCVVAAVRRDAEVVQAHIKYSQNTETWGKRHGLSFVFESITGRGMQYPPRHQNETPKEAWHSAPPPPLGVGSDQLTTTRGDLLSLHRDYEWLRGHRTDSSYVQRLQHESPLERLYLPKAAREVFFEIRTWLDSKDIYQAMDSPHRLGFGIYGPPGTGKTSFVLAVGKHFDLPVYQLMVGNMSDGELQDFVNGLQGYRTAAIILIEDLDTVFHGDRRRDDTMSGGALSAGKLSFDSIRRLLDWAHGGTTSALFFITTNDLSKMHSTLYDRPGRCDRVFEIPALDREGLQFIAKLWLKDEPELFDAAVKEAEEKLAQGSFTGAAMQRLCLRLLLEKRTKAAEAEKEAYLASLQQYAVLEHRYDADANYIGSKSVVLDDTEPN